MTAGGWEIWEQHYIDPVQYFLGKDNTSPVKVEVDAPQQASGCRRNMALYYLYL